MLNSTKLLYILSDVAYIAELLPGKKQHTFHVQAFRQINGEFYQKSALIAQNVLKLFKKLDPAEYTLVLADSLFTNTIITVEETDDEKISEHVRSKVLPKLQITEETHYLESSVLNEFKGSSQVQIAALTREVLAPVRAAVGQTEVSITAVVPLSWSIKSVISLEPSISVIQVGSELFAAQHYIGIDNTTSVPTDTPEVLAETIKTLKGTEPNIQTVYLISSELVQEKMSEVLGKTIPLQQLTSFKEEDSQMPSYMKHLLESGARTLSITEYPVPKFALEAATEEELAAYILPGDTESTAEAETPKGEQEAPNMPDIPAPSTAAGAAAQSVSEISLPEIPEVEQPAPKTEAGVEASEPAPTEDKTVDEAQETESEQSTEKVTASETAEEIEASSSTQPKESDSENTAAAVSAPVIAPSIPSAPAAEPADKPSELDSKPETSTVPEKPTPTADAPNEPAQEADESEVDLSKFSHAPGSSTPPAVSAGAPIPAQRKPIKNTGGVSNMMKMIFITTAVFFVTVAVGVGVGLGILSLTTNNAVEESPVVVATPAPSPVAEASPTPSPSPVAELEKSEFDILVVNATTKAGYAGTVTDDLTDFGTVRAANARGEYEPGLYVSVRDQNTQLIDALTEDTGLALVEDEDAIETEDPNETYDAVIVLAE